MRYRMVVRERSYITMDDFITILPAVQMEIKMTTHATRLPVGRQLLQPLGIAELDEDCDCPLFVVIVRCELQFPCTPNA
jgi:hypothetical protein